MFSYPANDFIVEAIKKRGKSTYSYIKLDGKFSNMSKMIKVKLSWI